MVALARAAVDSHQHGYWTIVPADAVGDRAERPSSTPMRNTTMSSQPRPSSTSSPRMYTYTNARRPASTPTSLRPPC